MASNSDRGVARKVARVVQGQPTSDGAGVKLLRVIGTSALSEHDPFLLLDEFRSDDPSAYIAGFPSHPHRGFETVTYMRAGRVRHRDNHGHAGVVEAGGVQWMTAGRGIIHSEMPEQSEGLLWGFQLWLNLPASQKMIAPAYQEFDANELPEVHPSPGVGLRLVAGSVGGQAGPVRGIATDPLLIDVTLAADSRHVQAVPGDHAVIAYVYDGALTLASDAAPLVVNKGQLAVFGDGDSIALEPHGERAGMLLAAARPVREPIYRHGPFVMNTRAEIVQAIEDFNAGKF